jgi:nucleoside-triphosphatase THEP1
MKNVLDSNHPLIGTISMKSDRFIQKIKERSSKLLYTRCVQGLLTKVRL